MLSVNDRETIKHLEELQTRMTNSLSQLDNTLFVISDNTDEGLSEQYQPDVD